MLNALLPPICANCGKEGAYLCIACKKKLHPHPPFCVYCHKYSQDFVTCMACKTTKENTRLDGCIIGFAYDTTIKKALLKLKYYHRKHIAKFFAQQLSFVMQSNPHLQSHINNSHGHTYISYVPSHWIRHHIVKGYNQSKVLAAALSEELMLPFRQIVRKTKHTKSQVKLNRSQRKTSLIGAFKLATMDLVGDETILLVDDITTTGSTLTEIAKTIKQLYPNIHIWGVVIGRSMK